MKKIHIVRQRTDRQGRLRHPVFFEGTVMKYTKIWKEAA
jgi:hypothetical protein